MIAVAAGRSLWLCARSNSSKWLVIARLATGLERPCTNLHWAPSGGADVVVATDDAGNEAVIDAIAPTGDCPSGLASYHPALLRSLVLLGPAFVEPVRALLLDLQTQLDAGNGLGSDSNQEKQHDLGLLALLRTGVGEEEGEATPQAGTAIIQPVTAVDEEDDIFADFMIPQAPPVIERTLTAAGSASTSELAAGGGSDGGFARLDQDRWKKPAILPDRSLASLLKRLTTPATARALFPHDSTIEASLLLHQLSAFVQAFDSVYSVEAHQPMVSQSLCAHVAAQFLLCFIYCPFACKRS